MLKHAKGLQFSVQPRGGMAAVVTGEIEYGTGNY